MLNIKERQKRLAYLGYYTGKIDGLEGPLTKKAYLLLQQAYFVNNQYRHDVDGIYGPNTEILLLNAYNVKLICKNFKLTEFKCHCKERYCSGYPHILDTTFLADLQLYRTAINIPINITSGLRCNKWNQLVGGSSGSRHKTGKAIDFYNAKTSKLEGRKPLINQWINDYVESRYGYCNGYANLNGKISYPSAPNMGTSIHIDVK